MDTNMNQYLIFRYASTVVRKMTAYQLCCAGLARSPFVLTEHISSKYIYTYIYINIARETSLWWRGHYVMWAELVSAISKRVTIKKMTY